MARKRRSNEISAALTGTEPSHSWKNQFSESVPAVQPAANEQRSKTDGYKRKTYLMTEDLIGRIEEQAQTHSVGVNEMARYCFDLALSLMESGQHKPEVQEVTIKKRTLGT
ncbi:MAG: hypothetical protein KDE46_00555 [Caldilineaceae bacterium]|nr:hypothetical protein [Caldilineaceae bacterium]